MLTWTLHCPPHVHSELSSGHWLSYSLEESGTSICIPAGKNSSFISFPPVVPSRSLINPSKKKVSREQNLIPESDKNILPYCQSSSWHQWKPGMFSTFSTKSFWMPILLPERSNTRENFGLNSLSNVYPHLYYKRRCKNKIILWAIAELHLWFLCLLYLVWVIWIFPSYMEHVPNLLSQTNPGSTVGSHIDTGDAMCSSKLWSPQEQHVLLRPKRTYSVCNVIANDNDITAFWILRGLQSHLPGHHPNLQLKSREQKLNCVSSRCERQESRRRHFSCVCCTSYIFFGNSDNSRAQLAGFDPFHTHWSTSSIALFPPKTLILALPFPIQGFVTGPKHILQTPLSQGAAFIPCARAHRVRMDVLLYRAPDHLLKLPRYHPRTSSPWFSLSLLSF